MSRPAGGWISVHWPSFLGGALVGVVGLFGVAAVVEVTSTPVPADAPAVSQQAGVCAGVEPSKYPPGSLERAIQESAAAGCEQLGLGHR